MELLVIDEVSMLRADLLDAMDYMMQTVRKKTAPFGGVQVLFIGDLLQLPPVIRDEEWRTLRNYYRGKFFFHSHVIQQSPPLYIELSKIFRQTDSSFISVLNNLRNKTGAGIMDCKKALVETGGDIEKARELLRKKGIASASKKALKTRAGGALNTRCSRTVPVIIILQYGYFLFTTIS